MRFANVTGLTCLTGLALLACAHTTESPVATAGDAAPAIAGEEDEAAASLEEHHRHHHHGGMTAFIVMGLDTLGVDSVKQPVIDRIHSDLNARLAPAREAENAVILALVDGIAAGDIDRTRVNAAIAQLTAAAGAVHDSTIDSLNELHSVLSPVERATLVDKVLAHWEVWRHVNQEEPAGGRDQGSRVVGLTRELGLSPDQEEKIASDLMPAMAGLTEHYDATALQAHISAFATAFVADSFDARTLLGGPSANAQLATRGATRMAVFYETANPVLTPAQRTQLAEDLREHLTHPQTTAR